MGAFPVIREHNNARGWERVGQAANAGKAGGQTVSRGAQRLSRKTHPPTMPTLPGES